jgi:hypothetical protein
VCTECTVYTEFRYILQPNNRWQSGYELMGDIWQLIDNYDQSRGLGSMVDVQYNYQIRRVASTNVCWKRANEQPSSVPKFIGDCFSRARFITSSSMIQE